MHCQKKMGKPALHYLSEFLRNVERPALWPLLPLLVVEAEVVVDEEDLQQLRHLDGDVERERDDDLEDDDERPEGQEAVPPGLDRLVVQLVQEGGVPEVVQYFKLM